MKKKKTVAFLVSGLMDDFTIRMAEGVMSEAASDEVDLVTVPVKYIDRDYTGLPDIYEYQYRTNASNLIPENVDVLLVAADCIGCLTTRENLIRFMESLPKVPTVLIATRMEGYAGVNFDNKSGVKDGLRYMIENLGVQRIGMLGGPDGQVDALERRQAYEEILREYSLPYRDTMFVVTNLSANCDSACELLLDMNPDLDAVFCVNDDVAMALYRVLRDRGLEPGGDVKILGFDNSRAAAMTNPSLSTVDADATELGRHGYRMVRRALNGEKMEMETTPTRFILRDSYGMVLGEEEGKKKDRLMDRDSLNQQFDSIFYRYRDAEQQDQSRLRNSFLLMMEDIVDYVDSGGRNPRRLQEIKNNAERFFTHDGALEYTDNDMLIPYIERIHGEVAGMFSDPAEKSNVYRTMSSILKRILKAMSNRLVTVESHLDDMLYSMKTMVKDTLNFTYGTDQSYETIVRSLVGVGIKNAYVYIFDKEIVHLDQEEFPMPDTVRLKAALTDGKILDIPYSQQVVRREELFDHPFIQQKPWRMVLMPLYFGDTVYGSILLDLTDILFRNGEFLVNQFSTTARVITILKQNNEIQKQLEENLAIMAENNIVLDRLSKNDVLTGILNRRGFFDRAMQIIAECRGEKKDVVLSYVDMNNLKVINDRFGHDDGDFSLKTISTVLIDVVDGKGTVGRIGGDEFALIYYGSLTEEELRQKINESFSRLNLESDKPYNITVSCGFFRLKPGDPISMEDAMATADQDLYLAKRFKDNRVVK